MKRIELEIRPNLVLNTHYLVLVDYNDGMTGEWNIGQYCLSLYCGEENYLFAFNRDCSCEEWYLHIGSPNILCWIDLPKVEEVMKDQ